MPIDLGVPKLSKDRFRFQPGENKVRVLDLSREWLISHFTKTGNIECLNTITGEGDCSLCHDKKQRTAKKLGYLYSYVDEKIVLAFVPRTVVTELQNFSNTEEYDYSEFPMPYDVTVTYDPKAAAKDKYKTLPARQNTPLLSGVLDDLQKRKPLDQIVESIRNKQVEAEPINDDEEKPSDYSDIPEEQIPF